MEIIIENKNLLDEEIKKDLQRIINEELSINLEVDRLTSQLYLIFLKNFKNIKFNNIDNKISLATMVLKNVNIFNQNFSVKFNCYNTNDKNNYNSMINKYHCYNGSTDFTNNIITINIGVFSGSKYLDFDNVLQHEIEHVFQMSKKGILNNYGKSDNNKLYNKALTVIQNKDKYNSYQFNCAFLLYYLSDNEVDAFVNQLYRELVNGNPMDEETIVANSSAMVYYKMSKNILNKLDINNIAYTTALWSLGIKTNKDRKWFLDYCEKAIDRAITKIGKVIVKARKEHENITVQYNDIKPTE